MFRVCELFVNCLVKQFSMGLGVVAILLLHVMEVFSVCAGAVCCLALWLVCLCLVLCGLSC